MPPRPRPLWHEAAALAARAHEHQLRKDRRTPYAAHPFRVAMVISNVFAVQDESVITAALLHDVIEDTPLDYDDIHRRFGVDVADIVAAMTKDMRLIEPERERRYDQQLLDGPWQGRLVKLADVYDNLADAGNEGSQRSFVLKARKAIDAAGGDERLQRACEKVEELIRAVESELDGR